MLLALFMVLLYTGCAAGSTIENSESEEIEELSIPASKPPAVDIDALFVSLMPGPSLVPEVKPDEIICTDYTSIGLLRVCYQGEEGAKLKLQVKMGENAIVYNLKGDGSIEDFPLQYGSGEYMARIMQNRKDDEYFAVETKKFDAQIENENDPFLNSIENIKWDYDKQPIKDVRYIISDSLVNEPEEKLLFSSTGDLYTYIVQNIKYDDKKIQYLLNTYLPDIEDTYATKKGICYDYASLLASMLRSINIPTKLVKGYANYDPETYHAWNEVYLDSEWYVIDTTKDASGTPGIMMKKAEDYLKVYEY